MIAVVNAAVTTQSAVVKAASAAKVAMMPSKLCLSRDSNFKAHVGLPTWAFLHQVKFLVELRYGEKICRGI
jgi:hypothetical protein